MDKNDEFYTLKGYKLKEKNFITEAMEDYLEMIFRMNNPVHINDLANKLNVKPSSASKMVNKLKEKKLVNFEKYGNINLTNEGYILGNFLLWRHNTLVDFFKWLNKNDYSLKQVEKIEHFVDLVSLKNMTKIKGKSK